MENIMHIFIIFTWQKFRTQIISADMHINVVNKLDFFYIKIVFNGHFYNVCV